MACNLICINYELKLVSNYYYIFVISIENRMNLLFFVANTICLMLSVSFYLFMFLLLYKLRMTKNYCKIGLVFFVGSIVSFVYFVDNVFDICCHRNSGSFERIEDAGNCYKWGS
jgi:hypothetical protein